MKLIPLTKGFFARVDDEDYPLVSQFKWSVWTRHKVNTEWRAIRGIHVNGRSKTLWMHHMILPPLPGFCVDHVNGDALDNQRHNLRYARRGENRANSLKNKSWKGRPCSSAFKGVCWCSDRHSWRAFLRENGKTHVLGSFEDEVSAAKAYDAAAKKFFGEFARVNGV